MSLSATQVVNNWFSKYIHNSPASRNEQTYNYLYKAKDALIKDLEEAETTNQSTTVTLNTAEKTTEEQPETPENPQKEG